MISLWPELQIRFYRGVSTDDTVNRLERFEIIASEVDVQVSSVVNQIITIACQTAIEQIYQN